MTPFVAIGMAIVSAGFTAKPRYASVSTCVAHTRSPTMRLMEPAPAPDVAKLRRFALTAGGVLLAYAIAGVELKSPTEVTVFGLQLVVRHPNLIGHALAVTSAYALIRFWLYATVFGVSPMFARRMIRRGETPRIPGRPNFTTAPADDHLAFLEATTHYFPHSVFGRPILSSRQKAKRSVKIPIEMSIVAGLGNIDFTAPIWLNVIALSIYAWNVLR